MKRLLVAAALLCIGACGSATSAGEPPAASTPMSATPTPSPTVSISAAPAGPFVDVAQFGFRMTIQPGLGSVTYTIDSAHAGPTEDLDGTKATFDGVIDLSSSSYEQACGSNTANPEAGIEVYTTSALSLHFASGPTMWKHLGKYLIGFSKPQEDPCMDPVVATDLAALQTMFSTAVAE